MSSERGWILFDEQIIPSKNERQNRFVLIWFGLFSVLGVIPNKIMLHACMYMKNMQKYSAD